jgi:hypothetical protein
VLESETGGGEMYRAMERIHASLLEVRGQGTVEYVALILLVSRVQRGRP